MSFTGEKRKLLFEDILRDEYSNFKYKPLRLEQFEYADIYAERILDDIIRAAKEERKKLKV
jgi:hypothetical protein